MSGWFKTDKRIDMKQAHLLFFKFGRLFSCFISVHPVV
jgi:hypothetical protein